MRKLIFPLLAVMLGSCAGTKSEASTDTAGGADKALPTVVFNADSAYNYVAKQVDFGPRINNTEPHRKTADYLASTLKKYGAEVVIQETTIRSADGVDLQVKNIMGMYNPESEDRLLLLAHWDTRPWADEDPNPANHKQPVPGANDGASGVGVLLEVARQLAENNPGRGVDILFVDAEDRGISQNEDSWALGARYFASNPIVKGYEPKEAILLDMVGAPGACFSREQYSAMYAPELLNKVWSIAQESGFGDYFKDEISGAVTDDHVQLLEAGIPAIDIIDFRSGPDAGFNPTWHTVSDNMENIDKETLRVVGQTILNYIFTGR